MRPRQRGRDRARAGRSRAGAGGARADLGAWIAAVVLAAVLAGASLLVDTGAESGFDALKRLATLAGITLAAGSLLVVPRPAGASARPAGASAWSWADLSRRQRVVLILGALAVTCALVSAIVSARRGASLDAARTLMLFAVLLPLGASRALDGHRAPILVAAFVGASVVNAVTSALQYAGIVKLFRVETIGGRLDASAFVGNDGVLALALALAAVLSGALALLATRLSIRLAAGGALACVLAGLAVNQSVTALIAAAAGAVVLIASVRERRVLVVGAALVIVLAGAVAWPPAFSSRAREAVNALRAGDWDRTLTYRLGPWAAALEMARARPLTGVGPGTFGAEFVPHRLQAELRFRQRLVNPFLAGSYTEAHSDYLQLLAEIGIPGALAAVAAGATLLVGVARAAARDGEATRRREALVVLAILCTGAAAALAWFPFQRPITAVPLLLAAGRAWRLCGGGSA